MFWYWFIGLFFILFITFVFTLIMMKKKESVLVGQVYGVFAFIVLVGLYFIIGGALR